jgi:hypothetical protein
MIFVFGFDILGQYLYITVTLNNPDFFFLSRAECTDMCKQRQRNIENDIKQLKRDLMLREEQFRQLEYENQVL